MALHDQNKIKGEFASILRQKTDEDTSWLYSQFEKNLASSILLQHGPVETKVV